MEPSAMVTVISRMHNSTVNSTHHISWSYSFVGLSVMQIKYIFASFSGIILFVGSVGNVLMLLVLIDAQRSSSGAIATMTSTLMINLTISDMLFLFYNVTILLVSFVFEDWQMGFAICVSSQSMSMWTMFCSFYTMVAISILRYIAAVHPTCGFSVSRAHRLVICLATWLMGFAVSIPNWIHQVVVQVEEANYCMLLMTSQQTFLYFVLFGGIAFLPFVLLLLVCYFRIVQSLWFSRSMVARSSAHIQHNQKATVIILIVLVVFVIMWIPCSVVIFLSAAQSLPQTPGAFIANNLSSVLAYSNCSVSPIICFSLSEQFQAGLRKLFQRGAGEGPG